MNGHSAFPTVKKWSKLGVAMMLVFTEQPTSFCLFARYSMILAISLLVCPWSSFAQSQRPSRPCPELPGLVGDWRAEEQWAWKQICAGKPADFQYYSSTDTPTQSQRNLGQRFLETILLADPYRSSIPRQGVEIVGARFPEGIDLRNAKLEHDLTLNGSRFEGPVRMRNLEVVGDLYLKGSYSVAPDTIDLAGARISGSLVLDEINAPHGLNMDSLKAGLLHAQNARFAPPPQGTVSMWLQNARIGTELDMSDARFEGELQMFNLEVGGDLKLLNSDLTRMLLKSARIGGMLEIEGPKRRGAIGPNRTEPRPKSDPPRFVDLTASSV
jgi:hypothetical protein